MAIFCFCSHYQSMIRRMITWQISAWKPFPASLFRLGWNSILILIHRLFQPAFLGWKYFSSLCQTGLECSTRAEFRGRLKLSRWNRQFDFKRISFGLSLPNDSSFPYMGWGGFFFFGIGCPVTAWLPSNLKMWATMQPWLRVHSVWNRLIRNSSRNIKPKWWRRQMVKPHHLMRRNTADFYGTCVQ